MRKRLLIPIAVSTIVVGALVAAAALTAPTVTARSATVEGRAVGQVLMGDTAVLELFTPAGRSTPYQRAQAVADRLRTAMKKPLRAEDFALSATGAGESIHTRGKLLVSVSPAEAAAHHATAFSLARTWRDQILQALSAKGTATEPVATKSAADATGKPAAASSAAPEPAPVESKPASDPVTGGATRTAVDWTANAQKWVPIFSLETGGAYIGAAQIAGPKAQVEKVKGVAELRLDFKGFARIYAYVPVSTISLTKLDRVQGVSVWATGDLQLVGF